MAGQSVSRSRSPANTLKQLQPKHDATAADICKTFDVRPASVRRWIHLGCPFVKRGGQNFFDAGEVAAWLKEHPNFGQGPGHPKAPTTDAKTAAELRRIEALATRYEIENAQRFGVLLFADEVADLIVEQIQNAKSKLIQLPAAVCAQLEGLDAATIEAVLDNRITEILSSISGSLDRQKPLIPRVAAPEKAEAE